VSSSRPPDNRHHRTFRRRSHPIRLGGCPLPTQLMRVVAAFTSPRSAVDAAVAAQRALLLPVRMGLATGEAELRDGDYFGTVLNRAARVMAVRHGGQVCWLTRRRPC
jgi:hypothetical protein